MEGLQKGRRKGVAIEKGRRVTQSEDWQMEKRLEGKEGE